MTIRRLIESTLEREPGFRERSRRDKGFIILLMERYPSLSHNSKSQLLDFAQDFANYTRTWNRILQEREDLRGSDYDQKIILEQEAELNLGYTPGFGQDLKMNKKL